MVSRPRGSRCSKLTPQIEHKPPSRRGGFSGIEFRRQVRGAISHRTSRETLFCTAMLGDKRNFGSLATSIPHLDKGLYDDGERLRLFEFYGEGA